MLMKSYFRRAWVIINLLNFLVSVREEVGVEEAEIITQVGGEEETPAAKEGEDEVMEELDPMLAPNYVVILSWVYVSMVMDAGFNTGLRFLHR